MMNTLKAKGKTSRANELQNVSWAFTGLCIAPLLALRAWMLCLRPQLGDFVSYWASGQLFLHGGHPYAESAMLATERLQGWNYTKPLLLLCPPWSLPFVAAFTWPGFRNAQVAWLAVSLLLNCFSAVGLWSFFGGEMRRAWIAILVVATFFPMGDAELLGQITPLILACLTAFLLLVQSEKLFLAGVVSLGLGFKPHLLFLVWLAILLWSVKEHAWRLLGGAALSFGAATLLAQWINPNSLDYFGQTFHAAVETSCGLGGVLRQIFGVDRVWLQFVPSLVGLAWFTFYWSRHQRLWNWRVHLPLLLVVSVSSSPYFWNHDFILILPAVMLIAVRFGYRNFFTLISYLAVQAICYAGYGWGFSDAMRTATGVLWIPFFVVAVARVRSFQPSQGSRASAIARQPESVEA